MRQTNIGVIGCGDILGAYMVGLRRLSPRVQVVRCGDLVLPLAEAAARKWNIPRWGSADELLADDNVDLVISLTPPAVHARVIEAAAAAGKPIYTEKPLASTVEAATVALKQAQQRGVAVGSAPDTFLGTGGQTARAAIDRGDIGEPIGCVAFYTYSRLERWHPNPRFFFQPGAGPVQDSGPYFIAALVNLLGPIARVSGMARIGVPVRRIPKPDGTVQELPVEVPTHATAGLEFASGAIGTFIASYDIWDHELPHLEVYGSEGTLSVPHPNWYDGRARVRLHDHDDWQLLEPVLPALQEAPKEKIRGLGVLDLSASLDSGIHRSNAEFAFHTLEVLASILSSSEEGSAVRLASTCERPPPLLREQLQDWMS